MLRGPRGKQVLLLQYVDDRPLAPSVYSFLLTTSRQSLQPASPQIPRNASVKPRRAKGADAMSRPRVSSPFPLLAGIVAQWNGKIDILCRGLQLLKARISANGDDV